ncbi:polyprenyl-phosphate transporter [Roseivirga pacifica]
MNRLVDYVLLYLKGIAMGSADVVPGVSGGTIAFITGIYEKLLQSIKNCDLQAFNYLKKLEIKALWEHINGTFLVVLLAGIATSVLSLAKVITHLLETQPIQVWSFFFGLIVISALIILREVKQWNFGVVIAILVGIGVAYYITSSTPAETPDEPWFLFIAGAVAICAMILPGISGSFILLLFGKYEYVLTAIKEFRIADLVFFGLGCIVGILSFARLVSWLFNKYHNITVGVLSGFMIGSLNKVWPWKDTIETYVDRHGEIKPLFQVNVLPNDYLAKTGGEPYFIEAIGFSALGFLLVLGIDRLAAYLSKD